MKSRVPWLERTFSFDFPVDIFPETIERVRGTPVRIRELTRGVPSEVLARRDGDSWSIQENVGHLADLDSLFMGRLDDYDAGLPTLRAADMANKATQDANHNARPFPAVLSDLQAGRCTIVARLESLAPEKFARVAVHPRLNQPMRLTDAIFFQAEHDDYHVARISALKRLFMGSG